MYGENGDRMRTELAALLRQHRVQHRLDSSSLDAPPDREATGLLIRHYRHTVLSWCAEAVLAFLARRDFGGLDDGFGFAHEAPPSR